MSQEPGMDLSDPAEMEAALARLARDLYGLELDEGSRSNLREQAKRMAALARTPLAREEEPFWLGRGRRG